MPHLPPLTQLKWIDYKDAEQTNWAINYAIKKIRFIALNIWALDDEIKKMEENERKNFLGDMKDAWRAKTFRKNAKSGRTGPKRSAFNVRLTSATLKAITTHSEILGCTKTQYIEKLIDNQISFENYYKNKLKEQNINKPKNNIQSQHIELKKQLETALKETEELRKLIPSHQNATNKTEIQNQVEPPSFDAYQSRAIVPEIMVFNLDANQSSPQTAEKTRKIVLRRRGPIRLRYPNTGDSD